MSQVKGDSIGKKSQGSPKKNDFDDDYQNRGSPLCSLVNPINYGLVPSMAHQPKERFFGTPRMYVMYNVQYVLVWPRNQF